MQEISTRGLDVARTSPKNSNVAREKGGHKGRFEDEDPKEIECLLETLQFQGLSLDDFPGHYQAIDFWRDLGLVLSPEEAEETLSQSDLKEHRLGGDPEQKIEFGNSAKVSQLLPSRLENSPHATEKPLAQALTGGKPCGSKSDANDGEHFWSQTQNVPAENLKGDRQVG